MTEPTAREIRSKIMKVKDKEYRICLTAIYLFASRVSEIVGRISPSDTVKRTYGVKAGDVELDEYNYNGVKTPVAVFRVPVAKRNMIRYVALPLDKKYEPWTESLYNYYMEYKDMPEYPIFPFTRQKIWNIAIDVFKGYTYPIETYRRRHGSMKVNVQRHFKRFGLHALRHMRISELVRYYKFTGMDLNKYVGWSLGNIMEHMPMMVERYSHLQWWDYFPKLLREKIW